MKFGSLARVHGRCVRGGVSLLASTSLVMPALAEERGPRVRTSAGMIEGVREGDLSVFKGVPLAQPPVGPLRWVDAQPAKPWSGVRRADTYAAPCMQARSPTIGGAVPSEDCLYLNVWTRDTTAKARRPVMVVIYGGGFTAGTASPPQTDGAPLARKDVVVVALPYRVGTLGYMAHPELSRESAHHTSGNYAMSDLVLGLRWVRDNAERFGGDPENVTVYGCSAGGHMTSYLVTSPSAAGLLRRAIPESGAQFTRNAMNTNMAPLARNEQIGLAIQKQLSVASLAEMRALPAERIVEVQAAGGANIDTMALPSVDGFYLPVDPYTAFRSGRFNHVDMITGWGSNEGAVFRPLWERMTTTANFARMVPVLAPGQEELFSGIYPHTSDAEARRSAITFTGDQLFGYQNWKLAQQMVRTGAPTWVYHYERPAGGPLLKAMAAGVPPEEQAGLHCGNDAFSNNAVKAGPWFAMPTASDYRLGETMSSYWINFARSGDPNGPGLPFWPRYNATVNAKVLRMNDYVSAGALPSMGRMRTLDMIYEGQRRMAR